MSEIVGSKEGGDVLIVLGESCPTGFIKSGTAWPGSSSEPGCLQGFCHPLAYREGLTACTSSERVARLEPENIALMGAYQPGSLTPESIEIADELEKTGEEPQEEAGESEPWALLLGGLLLVIVLIAIMLRR